MGILGRLFGRADKKDAVKAPDVAGIIEPLPEPLVVPSSAPMEAVAPQPAVMAPRVVDTAPKRAIAEPGDIDAVPRGAERVKRVMLPDRELAILDLRGVQSTRTRIVGSAHWVTDAGRKKHGGTEYLIVREPKNQWDASAVAVYGKGRKVGHLSEAKAAAFAPILDALDYDAFTVGGASVSVNSIRLWIDLPSLPALRAFVRTLGST